MKLSIEEVHVQNKDDPEFYDGYFVFIEEDNKKSHIATVWHKKGVDNHRIARTIEKMEEMKSCLQKYRKLYGRCPKTMLQNECAMESDSILDYIEHGDKEEMVAVAVIPNVIGSNGTIHKIPKSEAIERGWIKS